MMEADTKGIYLNPQLGVCVDIIYVYMFVSFIYPLQCTGVLLVRVRCKELKLYRIGNS